MSGLRRSNLYDRRVLWAGGQRSQVSIRSNRFPFLGPFQSASLNPAPITSPLRAMVERSATTELKLLRAAEAKSPKKWNANRPANFCRRQNRAGAAGPILVNDIYKNSGRLVGAGPQMAIQLNFLNLTKPQFQWLTPRSTAPKCMLPQNHRDYESISRAN